MSTNNKKASVALSNNLLHVSSCPGSHVINLTFGGGEGTKVPVKGVDYFTEEEINDITNEAAEKAATIVEEINQAGTPVVEIGAGSFEDGDIEEDNTDDDVIEF